jgi:hypothetical protein
VGYRVVALFRLAEDRSVEEYRERSLTHVRPIMRQMASVRRFHDFEIVGGMDGDPTSWQLCELIEITDIDQFEADNRSGVGAELAEEWRAWLSEWTVLYLWDLEDEGPA